jgi:Glycosyl hydrolase catalytic core
MRHWHWTVGRTLSRVRTLAMMAIALALVATPAAADAAKRPKKVPQDFVGVVTDGPVFTNPAVDLDSEMGRMVRNGVQTIRTVFNWGGAQPYATFDDVPPDQVDRFQNENGVPTDFSEIDRQVLAAATRHVAVLPVILTAPDWDARHPGDFASPPSDPQPYADFTGALVRRYGPGGAFWAAHSEVQAQPIRYWQIWNEPNLRPFWSDQPFAADYVTLLGAARASITAEDPGARIVLPGLANKSWTALEKIYQQGARKLFDIACFHPFTHDVSGVKTILEKDRKVMAKYHDSKKSLWVTELSWTSSKGRTNVLFGNEETEAGQAKKLSAAYKMLAAARGKLRIGRVYWYSWLSRDMQDDYPFDWAGLSRITSGGDIRAKPALGAYRTVALGLEHCRKKSGRADRCAR